MPALSASSGNAQLKLDRDRQKLVQIIEQIRDLDEETRPRQCTDCEPHRGTSQATHNMRLIAVRHGNIFHLFQCLAFCLTHGKPHKGERDRCGYRVESVSAGEADRLQQR